MAHSGRYGSSAVARLGRTLACFVAGGVLLAPCAAADDRYEVELVQQAIPETTKKGLSYDFDNDGRLDTLNREAFYFTNVSITFATGQTVYIDAPPTLTFHGLSVVSFNADRSYPSIVFGTFAYDVATDTFLPANQVVAVNNQGTFTRNSINLHLTGRDAACTRDYPGRSNPVCFFADYANADRVGDSRLVEIVAVAGSLQVIPMTAQAGLPFPSTDEERGQYGLGATFHDFSGDGLPDLLAVFQHSFALGAFSQPGGGAMPYSWFLSPGEYLKVWAPLAPDLAPAQAPPCAYVAMEDAPGGSSDFVVCRDRELQEWYTISLPLTSWSFSRPVRFWEQQDGKIVFAAKAGSAGPLNLFSLCKDGCSKARIGDVTVVEGQAGSADAIFTVTLSPPNPDETVTIDYSTAPVTATPGSDYTHRSSYVTFPPGVTSQTLSVPVLGDSAIEPDETFVVNLSNAVNSAIADGQAVGTILNDDFPAISVGDVTTTEGDAGVHNEYFPINLSAAVNYTVTANYAAAGITATGGVDFGSVSGIVSFAPNVTAVFIPVPVFGDRVAEPNETFALNLTGPTGGVIGDGQGIGTLNNDDLTGLSINNVVVQERVAPATATARFTVTLTPASSGTVTVNYATANGTATAGSDYAGATNALTFPPGVVTQTVSVIVNPDSLVEGVETLFVSLSGASGATIAQSIGTAHILDPPAGGDFNSDGKTDIVWHHRGSGQAVLWYMDGATQSSGTLTSPPGLSDTRWQVGGTNDFNADGRPDILWRHTTSGENVVWYMNGSVLLSGTFLTPAAPDVQWKMSGTGDFNLDGQPDILWRHSTSGEIEVWLMSGSVRLTTVSLTPSALANLSWELVGTGDFNGDAKTDILWRHSTSGELVVWFLEATTLMSGAFLNPPALADVRWRLVATGDYNSDGKVDIVWRHSESGQNVIWFMDGISLISGTLTNPSTVSDLGWKIVGPK